MKKLLLISVIACVAAVWFAGLQAAVSRNRAATASATGRLDVATAQLAEARKASVILRGEVEAKKNHLRLANRHPNITPDLLKLLEGNFADGSPAAWAQLRRELSLGWNASPDYVLVHKRILKDVTYDKFWNASEATDTACNLLSLSPKEKSALNAALKQLRDNWQGSTLTRTEPSGDIVAQYTLSAPDAAAMQSLSNNFTTSLAGAIGRERVDLLLPWGWNEFKGQLGTSEPWTLTIRQVVADGQPDLVCEMQIAGSQPYNEPVRYAHYPGGSFLTFFPGGWDTLAQREGFQLPPAFHKQPQ